MGGRFRGFQPSEGEVVDFKLVEVVGLSFVNVQVDAVEVEETVRQLVAGQGFHLHANIL